MNEIVRVLLADDHPALRLGATGESDQLPGLTGPEVAREIRRRGVAVRVLALSSYDDWYVRGMLEAGRWAIC